MGKNNLRKDNNIICEKNKCTGCFACYNCCPKNAIEMIEDEFGNLYPKINEKKCIHCDLCRKTCPQNKEEKLVRPKECYAIYNKNEEKRMESSSGGLASMLYEYILNNNGTVYGVSSNLSKGIRFIRIDKLSELKQIKGSKYVYSPVNDIFKKVKDDLTNDKKVLFIGTPCQVDGLKNFLRKDYENLITSDLICHGVPSQTFLMDELKFYEIPTDKVTSISFRNNNNFAIICYTSDDVIMNKNVKESTYLREFLRCNIYRENCYNCRYAQINRVSDITIGDFWGLSKNSKLYNERDNGISVALINTEKGKKIFEKIKEKSICEQRNIDEAQKRKYTITTSFKI